MAYDELRVLLDINDPVEVLRSVGSKHNNKNWFVVCDDGICHLFDENGEELDISTVKAITFSMMCMFTGSKHITIPAGVERIYGAAFYQYRSLESVTLPSTVIEIYINAFCQCTSLKSVELPASVKSIGEWAFLRCESLESVDVHGYAPCIGYNTFMHCPNLKRLTFRCNTLEQVRTMVEYPFGIADDESIIKCI